MYAVLEVAVCSGGSTGVYLDSVVVESSEIVELEESADASVRDAEEVMEAVSVAVSEVLVEDSVLSVL